MAPQAMDWADGRIVVTLEGEVGSVADKRRLLEHVAALPGVEGVVDRVRVTPARVMSDEEIRNRLCEELAEELAFRECAIRAIEGGVARVVRRAQVPGSPWIIDVRVDDGVVTLDGDVPSLAHKRLAGVMAWWIPGSRDVVNGLGVVPDEEDSDEEITEGVRLALEKDPFLESPEIRVTTRNRRVTLEGVVHSDAQRSIAEADAWYVFGVDEVDNRLDVVPLAGEARLSETRRPENQRSTST